MFNRKWRIVLILWSGLIVGVSFIFMQIQPVSADGTEELGVPEGVTIAKGSGLIAAGVGISDTITATLHITVPADSEVKQVLLYWSGGMAGDVLGEDTLTVAGQDIKGKAIGGPTFFFREAGDEVYFSAFRADITNLNLIQSGHNMLSIESQPFSRERDGVGVLVIYDDGSGDARLQIRDGIDMAYHGFREESRRLAVPQTFTFPAIDTDRRSRISMFFGSVAPHEPRSSVFTITVDSTVVVSERDLIGSLDGAQWDTINLEFDIPSGATSVTVEVLSPPNVEPNGASFSWVATGFFLLEPVVDRVVEPVADVQIRKYTNGFDAADPNGADVPEIATNEPITWTYRITNTGTTTLTQAQVVVSDSHSGITTTLDLNSDDGDGLFAPGESWLFYATGTGRDLITNPGNATVVQGCTTNGTSRPTYRNIGTVTIPGATASNPSHYCNPQVTPTEIEESKEPATNGVYYMPYIAR